MSAKKYLITSRPVKYSIVLHRPMYQKPFDGHDIIRIILSVIRSERIFHLRFGFHIHRTGYETAVSRKLSALKKILQIDNFLRKKYNSNKAIEEHFPMKSEYRKWGMNRAGPGPSPQGEKLRAMYLGA
jgi:hypothetical protein